MCIRDRPSGKSPRSLFVQSTRKVETLGFPPFWWEQRISDRPCRISQLLPRGRLPDSKSSHTLHKIERPCTSLYTVYANHMCACFCITLSHLACNHGVGLHLCLLTVFVVSSLKDAAGIINVSRDLTRTTCCAHGCLLYTSRCV